MPVIIRLSQLVNVPVKKCTWNFYYDARVIYLRNKETQQTLRVIVNIQYDASF